MTPLGLMQIFAMGCALTPFFLILRWNILNYTEYYGIKWFFILVMSLGSSFIGFVLVLITVIPILNFPVRYFVKANRGTQYSLETIAWMYHNALTYLVRYTVLEFITPTPLALIYFRAMGMKIGKGVVLNTSNISDPCMITLEDHVTIGGSASLMAHYGMKGYLIVAPVIIRKGATIGLKASVMGDVEVGEGATVPPHSALLPKTRVDAHTIYHPPVHH